MKVLGISGSPRKKGNTVTMINAALKGAAALGAKTDLIYLRDFNFSGCIACMGCKTKGHCVVEDDFQKIHSKVKESDNLVFGTPIYYADVTGITRCFMERLFFPNLTEDNNHGLQFRFDKPRNTVLMFNQANPNLEMAAAAVENAKQAFHLSGFPVVESIMAISGHSGKETAGQAEIMERVQNAGGKLFLG